MDVGQEAAPGSLGRVEGWRDVVYGGARLAFSVGFDEEVRADDHAAFVRGASAPHFAEITAAVGRAPARSLLGEPNGIQWRRDGEDVEIRTLGARAALRELGHGRFAARASLVPSGIGVPSLATALVTTAAELCGGVVMHGVAVALGDVAHLFVGPSGAGKTTAANHCPEARWLARDRAILVPGSDGYRVYGIAGGDPVELAPNPEQGLPLAAIHRIRRDRPKPAAERLGPARALMAVRENVMSGGGPAEEPHCLDRVMALIGAVPVFDLHTRLGAPLDAVLREAA